MYGSFRSDKSSRQASLFGSWCHSHMTHISRLLLVGISNPNKMSIASGNMTYFYMQRDSLCFLTLTEESYPKRLAFLYLEEVADAILQEFMQEFGNDVSPLLLGFVFSETKYMPSNSHFVYFPCNNSVATYCRPGRAPLCLYSLRSSHSEKAARVS